MVQRIKMPMVISRGNQKQRRPPPSDSNSVTRAVGRWTIPPVPPDGLLTNWGDRSSEEGGLVSHLVERLVAADTRSDAHNLLAKCQRMSAPVLTDVTKSKIANPRNSNGEKHRQNGSRIASKIVAPVR
jgi:hypothetical protein